LTAVLAELQIAGFTLARDIVNAESRDRLLRLVTPAVGSGAVHHRGGGAFAARGLLRKLSGLGRLLEACGIDALASAVLGDRAAPLDATFFDKHARANWTVPGHQDRIVAVAAGTARKHRIRGGIAYAELDAKTLAGLVALRIHFDPTDSETGALCVVPGSHLAGVMPSGHISNVPLDQYVPYAAGAGDVLILRPLLLHRSSPSRGEGRRRVLHVVYGTQELT
jgi:Phytanoyl-CoA dioxygenase (PhyH)